MEESNETHVGSCVEEKIDVVSSVEINSENVPEPGSSQLIPIALGHKYRPPPNLSQYQVKSETLDDDALCKMTISELYERMVGLSASERQKLRRRRQLLKNRIYTRTYRQRKKEELNKMKEKIAELSNKIDFYHNLAMYLPLQSIRVFPMLR